MPKRIIPIILAIVAATAAIAPAQFNDGDLVVSWTYPTFAFNGGFTARVNPAKGTVTTLAAMTIRVVHTHVRMAPDNTNLVVGDLDEGTGIGSLFLMTPKGNQTTIGASAPFGPRGFELDGDGHWIIAGVSGTKSPSHLWSLEHATGTISTLFSVTSNSEINTLTVDRDPGAPPYAIGMFRRINPVSIARIIGADRSGVVTTILAGGTSLTGIHGIDLNPLTGDYLVTSDTDPAINLVSKAGGITSLHTIGGEAFASRFAQDGTAWVVARPKLQVSLYRIDAKGTVLTMIPMTGIPAGAAVPTSVEVYGSRRLVCNGSGKPGTTMQIRLQSRRAGDGNQQYGLALSFGRRSGLKFPNGEWLHLAADPLFFLTATNAAPAMFASFRGTTDASGNANATVNIPGTLPANLGIPIFAAGVILDGTGVRTVTNTHWFVLD